MGGVVERREKETNSEKESRQKDALEAERVLVSGKEMSKESR